MSLGFERLIDFFNWRDSNPRPQCKWATDASCWNVTLTRNETSRWTKYLLKPRNLIRCTKCKALGSVLINKYQPVNTTAVVSRLQKVRAEVGQRAGGGTLWQRKRLRPAPGKCHMEGLHCSWLSPASPGHAQNGDGFRLWTSKTLCFNCKWIPSRYTCY